MSRVQCIDCGSAVVVDPAGFCPDGHHVGADGARIEAAIGVGVPYPDEPEPWVAEVLVDASVSAEPATSRAPRPPSSPDTAAAAAEPLSAATAPPTNGSAPSSNGHHATSDASEADDLLRELHSLSDELAAGSPPHVRVPSTSEPAPAPTPPSEPPTAAASSAPPADPAPDATPETPEAPATSVDNSAHSDGLAELRALEAAVNALTSSATETPPAASPDDGDGVVTQLPTPGQNDREAPDRDQLAEVEQLFAHRPRPLTEELPNQRPSQTGPPSETPPRPAFERTPWSSLPVEDQDDGSQHAQQANAPAATSSSRARRSGPPAGSEDALDLANFTAKGKRVGRAEAKRRKKGR